MNKGYVHIYTGNGKGKTTAALGLALRGVASSAMDVSDGLLGDFGHILKASGVGACIRTDETIKLIAAGAYLSSATSQFDQKLLQQCTLAGGDDY